MVNIDNNAPQYACDFLIEFHFEQVIKQKDTNFFDACILMLVS